MILLIFLDAAYQFKWRNLFLKWGIHELNSATGWYLEWWMASKGGLNLKMVSGLCWDHYTFHLPKLKLWHRQRPSMTSAREYPHLEWARDFQTREWCLSLILDNIPPQLNHLVECYFYKYQNGSVFQTQIYGNFELSNVTYSLLNYITMYDWELCSFSEKHFYSFCFTAHFELYNEVLLLIHNHKLVKRL
jgi:hypothetical protein